MDLVYINNLYDYYGSLLTEKQQQYFEEYYFEDLSLREISDNKEISRNAIHKQLKEVQNKLIYFESKLNLYKKREKIEKILTKIDDENIKEEIKELI